MNKKRVSLVGVIVTVICWVITAYGGACIYRHVNMMSGIAMIVIASIASSICLFLWFKVRFDK